MAGHLGAAVVGLRSWLIAGVGCHGQVDQTVNGLPLPSALCDAITEGRWRPPAADVLARVSADQFEVFEQMHYVCFHYEFEHGDTDVDQECSAGGCPSASLAGGRDRVIAIARDLTLEAASGAPWENAMTHQYLEALAAWLADSGGYYANRGRVAPGNGWEVVADALRAATVYE